MKNANPFRRIVAPCLSMLILNLSSGADESAISALEQLTARIVAQTSLVDRVIEERTSKYIEDLEKLEKTVAAETGDLDKVLIVQNEKKAWSAGNPTSPIDPKDGDFPLSLRKLRYYFDQELNQISLEGKQSTEAQREKFLKEFDALETAFTKTGEISSAVAVREAKETFLSEGLIAKNGNQPKAPTDPKANEVALKQTPMNEQPDVISDAEFVEGSYTLEELAEKLPNTEWVIQPPLGSSEDERRFRFSPERFGESHTFILKTSFSEKDYRWSNRTTAALVIHRPGGNSYWYCKIDTDFKRILLEPANEDADIAVAEIVTERFRLK